MVRRDANPMSPTRQEPRPVTEPRLIGGSPCLDFVNTLEWRGAERPAERLASYDDLATWSARAGLLSPRDVEALQHRAAAHPKLAEATLRRVYVLREALHRLFTGATARDADLAAVNAELDHAPARRCLALTGDGFAWTRQQRNARLEAMLWPIVWSAAELLVERPPGPTPARVKACADADCGALFYDTSRNRSRRWCAMEDCGNRAKARRHYARTRPRA